MPSPKHVLLASALAALVLVPAAPALAAPTRRFTVACRDGSTKSARVTYHLARHRGELTRLAAKNPCKTWLVVGWKPAGEHSDSKDDSVVVAPGARFDWRHLTFLAETVAAATYSDRPCPDGDGAHYVVGAEDDCDS